MTPNALRTLKLVTTAVFGNLHRRDPFRSALLCDNQNYRFQGQRVFSPQFLQEIDDLTQKLQAEFSGLFAFTFESYHVYEHHVTAWPIGLACKQQPNVAFTWYPNGSFLMRIGFGLT